MALPNVTAHSGETAARPSALIMTVGIPSDPRLDIASALAAEARSLEPVELVLVASSQSFKNALRIAEMLNKSEGEFEIVKLESSHDIDEGFRKINAAIDRLREKGIRPEEIAINFTSGTKIMSSAVVLSAVFNRCMELRYLTGAEAGSRRGRLIKMQPAAVYAFQDLLRGRNLALDLHFGSAKLFLSGVNDSLLTESGRRLRAQLLVVADAYQKRENFQPELFLREYESIQFDSPLLETFRMSAEQHEAVKKLVAEGEAGELGDSMLVELYTNGLRRLRAGAADDAAVRLYRAMEMLAQWVLRRDFEIDTNDVDTRRIPPRDRVAYEALRSMEDGMVKIGLRKSYELLVIMGTNVGARFKSLEPLHTYLAKRAGSVLAHGLQSVDLHDAKTFFDSARELFLAEIPDFDERVRLMQFPWFEARSGDMLRILGEDLIGPSSEELIKESEA